MTIEAAVFAAGSILIAALIWQTHQLTRRRLNEIHNDLDALKNLVSRLFVMGLNRKPEETAGSGTESAATQSDPAETKQTPAPSVELESELTTIASGGRCASLRGGRSYCSGSPIRRTRRRPCGVLRSTAWRVTVVNLASPLRLHSWCMLDSSCGTEPAPGWPSSGSGSCSSYLLALFSLPRVRDAMGPLLWRISLVIALNYIALVFAADFIEGPLKRGGIANYPLSYLPFALMLIAGAGLRVAALVHRKFRDWRPKRHVVGAS
jgi:hypothetical protein